MKINQGLVEAIMDKINFAEEAGYDLDSELYFAHASEGITPETVATHRNYDKEFIHSASEAFSQSAIAAVQAGASHETLSLGMGMGEGMSLVNSLHHNGQVEEDPWTMVTIVEADYDEAAQKIQDACLDALNNL